MDRPALGRRAGAAVGVDLRLVTKVAWMYHEEGRKQTEIAEELHISQSRVSRLLKSAVQSGIVRTLVQPPPGVFTALEGAIEKTFGIAECLIVEARESEQAITNDLGLAAADYLMASLLPTETIGLSSWSATWLGATRHLRPFKEPVADHVVQLVGGVGSPAVQTQATLLLDRLARATGAEPLFLQTPGIVGDGRAREVIMADPAIRRVVDVWDQLTVALLGLGSIDPSPLLRDSGNVVPRALLDEIRDKGGVGDICARYFDAEGRPVDADLDGRIVGISEQQLRRIPRRVVAAGGLRKLPAIRGALRGHWLDVLITDSETAAQLIEDAPEA